MLLDYEIWLMSEKRDDTPAARADFDQARYAWIEAREAAYGDENRPQAQRLVDGVPVDPMLPKDFDGTPHDLRPARETADWWGRPFVVRQRYGDGSVRWDVRILDGGAWDRSTSRGSYDSEAEAVEALLCGR